jgi:thioredoxin reductase (NADPH)
MKKKTVHLSMVAAGLLVILASCMNSKSTMPKVDERYELNKLAAYENLVPVAILGSGPAGLSAALYVGRAGFNVAVFEGSMPGGLLTQTTTVENVPGYIEVMGPDFINNLKEQATKWGARFAQDTVENVDFTQWPFKLETADGQVVYALTVILATGATPRYLGVPGEQEFWGKGVTTCAVCDAPFYKGEEVVVVGGGDSAAEEAMQLAPYAKNITMLVRADKMRASAAMQNRLKDYPHIAVRYNVQIQEISGDETQVTGVTLLNNKDNTTEHMPISGVFLAIGHIPNTAFLKEAVKLDPSGHIHLATRTQQTNVTGVFAAGDVADDRYRQAGVSAGHGISAALDATFFLNDIGFNEQHQADINRTYRAYVPEGLADYEVIEIEDLIAFQQVLQADKPVIVDFYAEWCPSCMQMLPAYAAVARDMQEQVTMIKVHADRGEEIMKAYKVAKIPTLLAFKNGNLVEHRPQTMTKRELYAFAASVADAA